jgi:putative intracellular protease/amidase
MKENHSRRNLMKTASIAALGLSGLTTNSRSAKGQTKGEKSVSSKGLDIVFYLYQGMTALDAIGTYEVLRGMPNAKVKFAAKERGAVRMNSQALTLQADYAIREIETADILVLPGGGSTLLQTQDQEVLAWVRKIHEKSKWTTSVCTGSFILAAAGLLKGLEATTHWRGLPLLASFGAKPVHKRMVRQGKIITAAGVSAGIDMALSLTALEYGDDVAKMIQLAIEYDPQPPFDSGSVDKASPEIVEKVKAFLEENNRRATGAQK